MSFSMEVSDEKKIKEEIAEQVKPVPEEIAKLKNLQKFYLRPFKLNLYFFNV